MLMTPETGALLEEFPYVRVGSGPRTLLVLPGVGDALFDGEYPPLAGWTLRAYFADYLDEYTVYLLSRPRGLPEDHTARDSAANHARVLDEALGPVDVLGISLGGMIALELNTIRPDLVERIVLANSGCRVAPESRPQIRELRRYATEHDWAAIRSDLATALFSDWRMITYPPIILTVGRILLPLPADPSDMRITLDIVREYDGTDQLGMIEQPTLVFGGTRDPYFTEPVVRETAEEIPNATLSFVNGAKHGAFHERKWSFDT